MLDEIPANGGYGIHVAHPHTILSTIDITTMKWSSSLLIGCPCNILPQHPASPDLANIDRRPLHTIQDTPWIAIANTR
jgi:proteasome lid subunit RPN8/RPN11